jgi:hypothetical protein
VVKSQPLWYYCSVIDADVINQAVPETAGTEIPASANIQTTIRGRQTSLRVFGYLNVINIENPVRAIPR